MKRAAIVALTVMLAACQTSGSSSGLSQLEQQAQRNLREYGISGVDVRSLSHAQLAQINAIANQPENPAKRAEMRSAVRGQGSLRGTFGSF